MSIELAFAAVLAVNLWHVFTLCKLVHGYSLLDSRCLEFFLGLLLGFEFQTVVLYESFVDLFGSNRRFLDWFDAPLKVG